MGFHYSFCNRTNDDVQLLERDYWVMMIIKSFLKKIIILFWNDRRGEQQYYKMALDFTIHLKI